jgi:hypothetical protein
MNVLCLHYPAGIPAPVLHGLAEACLRVSSQVAVREGEAVFVEAGGSRMLFGDEGLRARVAALDQLLAASQAALASAPGDPVLQRSVESAHAAREAALRALGGTLPASHQLVRY